VDLEALLADIEAKLEDYAEGAVPLSSLAATTDP
jgi:hypothetical protein